MKKGFFKMSAVKKFLTTLLATTVSIILTFGTTAIIDRRKKSVEKRELVIMIMYDLRESLEEVGRCENDLKALCDLQVDLVAHPDQFSDNHIQVLSHIPVLTYTTTAENIFKSNIETMNTIGNILFVEAVSSFYDARNKFKTEVVDALTQKVDSSLLDYEGLYAFNAPAFTFDGETYYQLMRCNYEECKLMMKVSEEELEVFSQERSKLQETMEETPLEVTSKSIRERRERDQALQKAREEGRKALL